MQAAFINSLAAWLGNLSQYASFLWDIQVIQGQDRNSSHSSVKGFYWQHEHCPSGSPFVSANKKGSSQSFPSLHEGTIFCVHNCASYMQMKNREGGGRGRGKEEVGTECHSSFHWLQQKQKDQKVLKKTNFPRLNII